MIYYIIEHPTKGTLRPDSEPGEPHFSWSGSRADEDKTWKFTNLNEAIRILEKFITKEKVRDACEIRQSPRFQIVYPKFKAKAERRWDARSNG